MENKQKELVEKALESFKKFDEAQMRMAIKRSEHDVRDRCVNPYCLFCIKHPSNGGR